MYPHLRVQIYSIVSFFQILMNAWIQRCLVARVASVFVKTHRVATCVNVNRVCYILTTLAKVSSLFQIHDKTQGQRLKGLWHCYLVHRASLAKNASPEEGYSGFEVTGMILGFFGFESFVFGIFLGGKILAGYFLGSLI